MHRLWILCCLLLAVAPAGRAQDCNPAPADNVNSRYTVESVELSNRDRKKLSRTLLHDIDKLVGEKFNQQLADNIAARMRKELHASKVTAKVTRGDQPDHVKLQYESEKSYSLSADGTLLKHSYHSRQGWTGGLEFAEHIAGLDYAFGVQSDGDELVERYAGINARIARNIVPRVRLAFDFQSFHQQWNPATLAALPQSPDVPGIYRIRRNYQPSLTVLLTPRLTYTLGTSFEQFQSQFPAAGIEAANAVINTLRYRGERQLSDSFRQELNAEYSLRAATRILDSDYVYARHLVSASYSLHHAHSTATVRFLDGAIAGRAPLFERFVLGNAATLRGWNKFDLDPLGGKHVAYGSVQYRYRFLHAFYDTGAVWDNAVDRQQRHSAGGGLIFKGISFAVAFPLREGNMGAVFIVGVGL